MILTKNSYSAREVRKLMILSYKRYQNGSINEAKAYRENVMLANILKAIEASEQEERLEKLVRALLKTKDL